MVKLKNRALACFKLIDPDKNVFFIFCSLFNYIIMQGIGYKAIVQKLSGFAKFDLDTKMNSFMFFKYIEKVTSVEKEADQVMYYMDEHDSPIMRQIGEKYKEIDE